MTSLAPSPLSPTYTSSPLNPTGRPSGVHRDSVPVRRNFPTSRPLRPFTPTVAQPAKKGIKLIVPKSAGSQMFVLHLTPDELARNV